MGVGAGYKQTEVGVIPEDWEVNELDELTDKIGSGITPKGGSTVYKESGRPFVRSQNIGWGELKLTDIAFIEDAVHATFPNTEIKLDDVFLNISGASIGRSSYANEKLVGGNVNQHVCIIRTMPEKLDHVFLSSYLLSSFGQKQIDSFQSGGNREGLNIGQIRSFKIPTPPLPEQKAIARVLSDMDALIGSLEQKIAKKRLVRAGVMQELLRPKEGWVETTLGQCAKVIGGGTPSTRNRQYWGGNIEWFTPTEVGKRKYLHSSKRKITFEGLSSSSAQLLPKGSILLTSRAGIGNLGILKVNATTNQGFQSLIVNKENDVEFFYYLLNTLKSELISNASGSTFLEISPNKLKSIEIKIPELKVQTSIGMILSTMDKELVELENLLSKHQLLKQSLMQQLLTGRVRLLVGSKQ